jgi:hypothetical protein
MLLTSLSVSPEQFHKGSGWQLKPEGLCRGEVCVPITNATTASGDIDVTSVAERLGMPLEHDEASSSWALGPSTLGGRALETAALPSIVLEDRHGNPFDLAALHGRKTLLVAWASW